MTRFCFKAHVHISARTWQEAMYQIAQTIEGMSGQAAPPSAGVDPDSVIMIEQYAEEVLH